MVLCQACNDMIRMSSFIISNNARFACKYREMCTNAKKRKFFLDIFIQTFLFDGYKLNQLVLWKYKNGDCEIMAAWVEKRKIPYLLPSSKRGGGWG